MRCPVPATLHDVVFNSYFVFDIDSSSSFLMKEVWFVEFLLVWKGARVVVSSLRPAHSKCMHEETKYDGRMSYKVYVKSLSTSQNMSSPCIFFPSTCITITYTLVVVYILDGATIHYAYVTFCFQKDYVFMPWWWLRLLLYLYGNYWKSWGTICMSFPCTIFVYAECKTKARWLCS